MRLPPHRRLPIGSHGTLLPFVIVPLGFTLGSALGVVRLDQEGLVAFDAVRLMYVRAAFVFPVVIAIYYLVWKFIVGFLNDVVRVE